MIHHYIFYVLYKLAARTSTIFPKDFVACVGFLVLILWGGWALTNEHYVITQKRILPVQLGLKHYVIILLPPVLFIWSVFLYNNKWRIIVQSIEDEAPEKRKKYVILAWIIIAVIVINLILSIYLLKWNYDKVMGV